MPRLSIAVVSDLHIGGARSRDLCPKDPPDVPDENYVDRFRAHAATHGIQSDIVLCPGDATQGLDPAEVQRSAQVLREIATALGVADDKIYYTPGNHDVDWSAMRIPDTTGFRRTQRFEPMRAGGGHLDQWCRLGSGVLLEAPHVSVVDSPDIRLALVNTVAHDGPDSKVHHGAVSQESVEALDQALQSLAQTDSPRVCLLHHHPIQYTNPLPDDVDFSVMSNAENLLSVLAQHRFDILVHGHRHSPRVVTYSVNGSHPLVIVGAGSFSARLDSRWAGIVNNQFHIIRVDGRTSQGCVKGQVESWAYVASSGWVPSQQHNGIAHLRRFGLHLVPADLDARIAAVFSAVSPGGAPFDDVKFFEHDPEMRLVANEALEQSLGRVCKELGYERYGDITGNFLLTRR